MDFAKGTGETSQGRELDAGTKWMLYCQVEESSLHSIAMPSMTSVRDIEPTTRRALPRVMPMRQRPRSFSISDGMIVVAAVACAIALARFWNRELSEELPTFFFAAGFSTAARTRYSGWAMSVLVPGTLAVILLRSRRPRPRLWLLARQPGAVACGTAALMLAIEIVSLPLNLRTMGAYTSPLLVAAWYWPVSVGSVVIASWLTLAVSKRWRGGADWVDRTGMFVGTGWVALPFVLSLIEFL